MPENQTNSALNNLNEIEQKMFNNSLQSELSVKIINMRLKNKVLSNFYQLILELKMKI